MHDLRKSPCIGSTISKKGLLTVSKKTVKFFRFNRYLIHLVMEVLGADIFKTLYKMENNIIQSVLLYILWNILTLK